MSFKFKVGDKVRIKDSILTHTVGKEGVVTKLGGVATPDKGAVVTNASFPSGCVEMYGKHGIWFSDDWLELIGETTE